jgi:diphosphomevalonate decarboxylase
MSDPGAATAVAGTNIALVKYWGKRDAALNLPAAGSLSLTLDALGTRTSVRFSDALAADRLVLNGAEADARATARASAFLDRVRARARSGARAEVVSDNSVPTASGLASSASGFAAGAGGGAARASAHPPSCRSSRARARLGGALDLRWLRRDGARRVPTAPTPSRRPWPAATPGPTCGSSSA